MRPRARRPLAVLLLLVLTGAVSGATADDPTYVSPRMISTPELEAGTASVSGPLTVGNASASRIDFVTAAPAGFGMNAVWNGGNPSMFWGYNAFDGNVVEPNDTAIWFGLETNYLGRIEHYFTVVDPGGEVHRIHQMDVNRTDARDARWRWGGNSIGFAPQDVIENQTGDTVVFDFVNNRSHIGTRLGVNGASGDMVEHAITLGTAPQYLAGMQTDGSGTRRLVGLGSDGVVEVGDPDTDLRFVRNPTLPPNGRIQGVNPDDFLQFDDAEQTVLASSDGVFVLLDTNGNGNAAFTVAGNQSTPDTAPVALQVLEDGTTRLGKTLVFPDEPTLECTEAARGSTRLVHGSWNDADRLEICLKSHSGDFVWEPIAVGGATAAATVDEVGASAVAASTERSVPAVGVVAVFAAAALALTASRLRRAP